MSKAYAFLTLVIYTPSPLNPPSHSDITPPTTEYEAEILSAAKNFPIEDGNLINLYISNSLAPIDLSRFISSLSALLKLSKSPIVIGKNVTSTISITFGNKSYPNQSTKSGAMAIVGMV